MTKVRIGTRKSPLALVQAEEVAARLKAQWPEVACEIVAMSTSGDKFMGSLMEVGGKGLFTKELEEGLFAREVDIAVHSMKDMPTMLPDGLIIPCVLPREDARDVLISPHATSIAELPEASTFGTSSLRRAAQLLHRRPDLTIVPLRGNVQTRIDKIAQGVAMGTMLARAGLNRLQLKNIPAHDIPVAECLPAVAQGAIGIECRADDVKIQQLLAPLNDAPTMAAITCERAFLRVLDGSCRTPIAGYAQLANGNLMFDGLIANPDGTNLRRSSIQGAVADAEKLGNEAGLILKS